MGLRVLRFRVQGLEFGGSDLGLRFKGIGSLSRGIFTSRNLQDPGLSVQVLYNHVLISKPVLQLG